MELLDVVDRENQPRQFWKSRLPVRTALLQLVGTGVGSHRRVLCVKCSVCMILRRRLVSVVEDSSGLRIVPVRRRVHLVINRQELVRQECGNGGKEVRDGHCRVRLR
jgi:hypothetical protein